MSQQLSTERDFKLTVPHVTLVICTHNRASRLDPCLTAAVAQQVKYSWEILLVDSASTDRTAEVLRSWVGRFPELIRHISVARPGLGRARQEALRSTRSTLVAFTDDDCYVAPDFLMAICRVFENDATIGAIGGRVMLHDSRDYPITINESRIRRVIKPRHGVLPGLIHGANMAFRRAAIEAVGGFDERLGAGTGFANEDVDAIARVNAAGWFVSYEPEPMVRHDHGRRELQEVEKLVQAYDHGRGAFFIKMLLMGEWKYLLRWMRTVMTQSPRVTGREIRGAIDFARLISGGHPT